jgi:putative cell wall binding repeat protein
LRPRRRRYRGLPVNLPSGPLNAGVFLAAVISALTLGACGGEGNLIEVRVQGGDQGSVLGFPVLATKNTTRVAGKDPVQDAAAVASAVYPAVDGRQPQAVTLVDQNDWAGGIAAAALMAPPLRAPILLTDGDQVPGATSDALDLLRPTGAPLVRRAQGFKIGGAAAPDGLRTFPIQAKGPFRLAAAVDEFRTRMTGRPSRNVIVVSAHDPRFAMPAAAWAAKSGDPVLFTDENSVPPETRSAIDRHERPNIYVLGPKTVISDAVVKQLRRSGQVTRISGSTPVTNAIVFARYSDGSFGWGIQDPGHGLVIANWHRPSDAPAAAALSASGKYGPLLLTDSAKLLPRFLRGYLLDIQPGYRSDPVRGVYNHAWLIGDESAIGVAVQTEIDELTEIVRVRGTP